MGDTFCDNMQYSLKMYISMNYYCFYFEKNILLYKSNDFIMSQFLKVKPSFYFGGL